MVEMNSRKAAIIGCGFVGSASAFSLMESHLFSEIVLIDADKDRAEGEALDISHGLPFSKPMQIYAGTYQDISDAAVVIVTAGAGQKPGETRLDLVKKNVAIFKSIIPEVAKYNRSGILLIVANPVDILTYVAKQLSGYPSNRVFGSGTVLDTARLKYLLGEHLGVDSRSIHAFQNRRGGQEQRLRDHKAQEGDLLRHRDVGKAHLRSDCQGREIDPACIEHTEFGENQRRRAQYARDCRKARR